MIIINPGYDGADIYDGESLIVISNKNSNIDMICKSIISLCHISKEQEFGIVSTGIGIGYSDYFKSKGYNVKDIKIQSIK